MEFRESLIEGFDYDLWANRKWLFALESFDGQMFEASQVLEHILFAQRIWIERCGVQVLEPSENVPLDGLLELYCRAWQAQLMERPLQEPIAYENLAGVPFVNTLEQIARHVINHGTYHRGHLRGLAAKNPEQPFPETDLIGFFRERV